MTKLEIIEALGQKHQTLYKWLENQPNQNWIKGPDGKWDTGQHILHLIQSEKTLNKALWVPKFYLKHKFGINNRANRTYDQIVKKYQSKLHENPGVVANISKYMQKSSIDNKANYISKLEKEKRSLIKKLRKWNDQDLDTYLLPHPLLGRMTIREIFLWTVYHTEHHYANLKSKY